MVITWSRARGIAQYAKYFKLKEFECKDGVCSLQMIDTDLLEKLDKVREELGAPITVTSGFRCINHQAALTNQGLQTVKNSQHLQGKAVDIRAKDMARLLEILEKHFKAIGIAKTFYHIDLRDDEVRRWNYS